MCDGRDRRNGRPDAVGGRQSGAPGRARVPVDQSSARLPDLRPGRGVRAAGFRLPGRPRQHAVRRVRQALQSGGGLRSGRPVRAEPLHPVHALRALHGGRRPGAGAQRVRTRRSRHHRDPPRRATRSSVVRQRGGPVPGGVAALQGFPPQGARLGARQDGVGVHRLFAGVQRHARPAGQHGGAGAAASQSRREPVLHLRSRPGQLPLDEPGRPDRSSAGARRRRAPRRRLGRGAGACAGDRSGRRRPRRHDRESPGVDRSAVSRAAGVHAAQMDRRVPGRDGRGSSARGRAQSGAACRTGSQRRRGDAAGLHPGFRRRAQGRRQGRGCAGARRNRSVCAHRGGVDLRGDRAARECQVGRGGAAARQHGGRGRDLREPGRPGAALLSGEADPRYGAPAWWALGELLATLEGGEAPGSAAEVFEQLAASVGGFGGLSYATLGLAGQTMPAGAAVPA